MGRFFSKGGELVSFLEHSPLQTTAVTPANIECVEQLIFENGQITVCEMAQELEYSVRSVMNNC